MKYILYLTICLENNKIYIGVHKTENPDIFDGYIGCGVRVGVPSSYNDGNTPFKKAVLKYGESKFRRITLKVCDSEKAFSLERDLVNESFIKRNDTYNIKLGGEGGCPECLKTKVYMYDLEGNFVREFDTVLECNRFFNPNSKTGGHIPRAIKLGHIMGGYQFSYEKVDKMPKYKRKNGSHTKIKIGKYDENGNLVKVYNSSTECRKDGYTNLSRALKYGSKHNGYYFKYFDE